MIFHIVNPKSFILNIAQMMARFTTLTEFGSKLPLNGNCTAIYLGIFFANII